MTIQDHPFLTQTTVESISYGKISTERIHFSSLPADAYSASIRADKAEERINISFFKTTVSKRPPTAARLGKCDDKQLFNSTIEVALIASFSGLTALLIAVVIGCLCFQQSTQNCKYIL